MKARVEILKKAKDQGKQFQQFADIKVELKKHGLEIDHLNPLRRQLSKLRSWDLMPI